LNRTETENCVTFVLETVKCLRKTLEHIRRDEKKDGQPERAQDRGVRLPNPKFHRSVEDRLTCIPRYNVRVRLIYWILRLDIGQNPNLFRMQRMPGWRRSRKNANSLWKVVLHS